MNPIKMNKWKYLYSENALNGLFVHFEKGIHPYIKHWLMLYCRWLRKNLYFPVRLHVYCKKTIMVQCRDKSKAYGVIFVPDNRSYYPNIHLGCGIYSENSVADIDAIKSLDSIIYTLSHELVHYYQYINGINLDKLRSVEWQASYHANRVAQRFYSEHDEKEFNYNGIRRTEV